MKQAIRKALLLFVAGALAIASQSTWSTAAAQSSSTSTDSTRITITPSSSQRVITGAPDRFTGSVRIQSLFDANKPARSTGGLVTFQPGARSAWHTHPLGQILSVTDGVGWVKQWGGPVQVIRKGDVVWIPAGVKHWHGATPTTTMTHLAFQEQLDGRAVDWLERSLMNNTGLRNNRGCIISVKVMEGERLCRMHREALAW